MESRSLFLETGGEPNTPSTASRCRSFFANVTDPNKWPVSPVFVGLCAGWTASLLLLYFMPSMKIFVFFSGLLFWLISLAVHEWGHAITAYKGGDRSVAERGYLTLDLTRYVEPMMSIVLPTLFLLFGGFALPGGAVYIQPGNLRSKKWESAVSLAGPAANFVCAVFAAVLLQCVKGTAGFTSDGQQMVAATLALCAYFQVMASYLNLLPLPPLDGWGAISPWLSDDNFIKRALRDPNWSRTVNLLTIVIIFVGVARISYFGQAISATLSAIGVESWLVGVGLSAFKINNNPMQ